MANTNNIQWKRLSAEGAAIVVSILLAFSIEAWWDDYQDRGEEQGILLGLQSEFAQNLAFIDTQLSYRSAVIDSILKIFDASVARTSMEPDILDELIGDVTWWENIEYSRGAIDGLLQSGGLSLIENEELRRVIASMPSRYDSTTKSGLNDRYTSVNVVIPFLNTHASLSQIANIQWQKDGPEPSCLRRHRYTPQVNRGTIQGCFAIRSFWAFWFRNIGII
jgi:hypothetical protein